MEKLWSRKEVCETLGISMRTLTRKLRELGIECVNEILANNVVSMKIQHEDYLKLAQIYQGKDASGAMPGTGEEKAVAAARAISEQLTRATKDYEGALLLLEEKNKLLEYKDKMLDEKDKLIEILRQEKARSEEKNDRLFNEMLDMNKKMIDAESQKPKGLFSRLFGR